MKPILLYTFALFSFFAHTQLLYDYSVVYEDNLNDNKGKWTISDDWKSKSTIQNGMLTHSFHASGFLTANVTSINSIDTITSNKVLTFKLANLNNEQGVSYYEFKKQDNGEIKKLNKTIAHPMVGFTWGYKDYDNYHAIYFRTFEDYGSVHTVFKVISYVSGQEIVHQNWKRSSNLSSGTGFNEVKLQFSGKYCSVYLGFYHSTMQPDAIFQISDWFDNKVGVLISSPGKIALDYIKLERMTLQPLKINYNISLIEINNIVNSISTELSKQNVSFFIETKPSGKRVFKIDYQEVDGLPNDEVVYCKDFIGNLFNLFYQQINYNRETPIPMSDLIEVLKEKGIEGFDFKTKNKAHVFLWRDLNF